MKNHFIPYNPKLKARARDLRNNMTAGEKMLWQRLRKKKIMGYDFDRQKPMDQFIVDFYCKALALAIEVDGSVHDSSKAQLRDQERQARLEALGIRFLRFSDDAVRQDINGVCLAITDWIKQHNESARVSPLAPRGDAGSHRSDGREEC